MGIDNILDLMTYENEQERQEAIKYINLKGFMQYKRAIEFCIGEGYDKPTYKQVSHLYKYDKRLRDTLFKYIATIEEYIRATIGNRYENDVNKLTLTPKLRTRLKEFTSLSIALEHLMLGELKDLVLKNKDVFNDIYVIDDNLETNLEALISLRNKVGHHNFLLAEKYKKCVVNENEDQTLEANIKNLQQFLPKDFRKGFANSIRGCSERLVLPSKYVIDIQPLTIDEKIVEKISKQCYTIIMNDANSFAGFLDSVYLSLNDENWNHSQEILYIKAINHYKIDITSIGRDTEERLLNLYRICCPQFNLLFDEECLKQKKTNKASLKVLFFKFMRKYEAFTSFMFGIILIIILIYGSFNMHQQEPDSWSADLYMGLASSVLAAIIIMYVNKRKKKKARKNESIINNVIIWSIV